MVDYELRKVKYGDDAFRLDGAIYRDDDGDIREIENDLLDGLIKLVESFGCSLSGMFGTRQP